MKPELRIVAPFHNSSGFAAAGRALLRTALLASFKVQAVESERSTEINRYRNSEKEWTEIGRIPMFADKIGLLEPFQKEELEAAFATEVADDAPTLLLQNPSGMAGFPDYTGPRIGLTMLESDRLHPLWARPARNVDLLLGPSQFCVDIFNRDVKDTPTGLLPLPVDERMWSPEGSIAEIGEKPAFVFLSVFSTCERKNWRLLCQAFVEEFRGEDVGIVLKCNHGREVKEFATWCEGMGCWMKVVDTPWTQEELASAYRAVDCYVLPSTEGFGLPFIEAALCGIPSIALDHGGAADVVTEETGYLIPSIEQQSIGHLPQVYPSTHNRYTCTIQELRSALRRAYEDADIKKKGRAAREFAMEHFTPCALVDRLVRAVKDASYTFESRAVPRGLIAIDTPPLVVIITTHNNLESTKRTIESVKEHTPDSIIFLADDGSTDGTVEWARSQRLEYVECNTLGNVSKNRQKATEYAAYCGYPDAYIAYLDNDVQVTPGWWDRLHSIFQAMPQVGIIAPKKLFGNVEGAPELKGEMQCTANNLWMNAGSYPLGLDRPIVYGEYVESACMIMRPEVAAQVEWDPQFDIFYEDCDISYQCRQLGFDVIATNVVSVIHDAHTTSVGRRESSERNRLRFLIKWRDRL